MAPTSNRGVASDCRWCNHGPCDGRFVRKLVQGEVSNRRNGPIPTAVWELMASADMDDVEDALKAHGLRADTARWAAAKKNLRRVRNQYRARLCQARVRTELANEKAECKALQQQLDDERAATAYQRARADRAEAALHAALLAAPHAVPHAERLKTLVGATG